MTLSTATTTASRADAEGRRATENMKIACAHRHFETIEVDYEDVTTGEEFRARVLAKRRPSA